MTKYKQSWLRLPTEYDDVKVEVSAEGPYVCCCAPAPPRRLMCVFCVCVHQYASLRRAPVCF